VNGNDKGAGVAERSMGFGLRALNRLAGSDLLDRIRVRKLTERALFQGTKNGFRSATVAGRAFKATQKLTRPARQATKLHCPWLLCVGEADRVARPGPAIAAARRAPHAELRTYPGVDHFDIYDGPEFEAIVADEVEFLRRHLLSASDPSPAVGISTA